jgi:tetratricopeptide (TPR) repeat protein
MNFRPFVLAMLCVVALAGGGAARAADELAEVARLHQTGQSSAALQRADQFLASTPRDPQMRFLKAVILSDSGRNADAIAVLDKLTEDYPDLPEPYNNLAVLYAASGNYAKARDALEQALRLSPGYATAHANLADVYVALARQAYTTALRLEPARVDIPAKLALLQQVTTPRTLRSPAAAASAATLGKQ